MNQKPELLIAIAVPPGWYRHWSVILQIRSPVLLQRETTRDRSYQGPSIMSRLLWRTLPTKALGTQRTGSYQGFVRFASIMHINTQYDLFIEYQYPSSSYLSSYNPAALAVNHPLIRVLAYKSTTWHVRSRPILQSTLVIISNTGI